MNHFLDFRDCVKFSTLRGRGFKFFLNKVLFLNLLYIDLLQNGSKYQLACIYPYISPKRIWIAPTGHPSAPAFLSVGDNVYRY